MQRLQLINTLKRALRAQKITYADVAKHLNLSVASVKRLFHRGDLSLSRLEQICDLAGLQLAELVETMAAAEPLVSELTPEQERELTGNPKLLLMCYLLINRWEISEIIKHFQIDDDDAKKLLRRLRDLKLIEILPFDRIKVLQRQLQLAAGRSGAAPFPPASAKGLFQHGFRPAGRRAVPVGRTAIGRFPPARRTRDAPPGG